MAKGLASVPAKGTHLFAASVTTRVGGLELGVDRVFLLSTETGVDGFLVYVNVGTMGTGKGGLGISGLGVGLQFFGP